MKKFSIGFFLAFTIFLVPRSVSAASFPLPESFFENSYFSSTHPDFDYHEACSNFFDSFSQFDPDSVFLVFGYGTGLFPTSDVYVFVYSIDSVVSTYSDYIYLKSYPTTLFYTSNFIDYSDYHGNLHPTYPRSLCYDTSNSVYMFCVLDSSGNFYYADPNTVGICIVTDTSDIYEPDYSLTGVIVGYDFSYEAFYHWLIDTGKYAELPSYIGTSKLLSFVKFYHDWGSNNNIFVVKILEWMMHYNIFSQSLENRNILKSTIDRLYQEYCNGAFVTIRDSSARLPHHRRNIETLTTDDDLTLVTDDSNDDIYTSLLRDILRGVISISGQIYNCTEMIISKLDYLNWNVTVSNGGVLLVLIFHQFLISWMILLINLKLIQFQLRLIKQYKMILISFLMIGI